MRLLELIEGLAIQPVVGSLEVQIKGLADDSRRIAGGEVFIARSGSSTDGRRFIADALSRGAAAVICDQPIEAKAGAVLHTPDLAGTTVDLARRFYGDPADKLKLVGITGTKGKTTTAFMVRHLLNASGLRCGLIGTVEIDDGRRRRPSDLTTPGVLELFALLAEMVRNDCRACAMEVSSHALDQGRTRGLSFAVGAFTNLSGDHLDYHKTMDAYAAAKSRLFASLEPTGTAVVNAEDPAAHTMLRDCRARRLSFGDIRGVDCRITVHASSAQQTDCTFEGPWGALRAPLPLIGRHNALNMAAALCCIHALGIDVGGLCSAVEECPQVPGRLERIVLKAQGSRLKARFDVFVDYAHTDDPLRKVLEALRPLTRGQLRVMFGCGGDRDTTKRPRMARVACELADQVIVTTDNPRTEDPLSIIEQILAGVPGEARPKVAIVPDRAQAIEQIIRDAGPGDVVLLAGKGHEDYQIIGRDKRPFDDRLVARRVLQSLGPAPASSRTIRGRAPSRISA